MIESGHINITEIVGAQSCSVQGEGENCGAVVDGKMVAAPRLPPSLSWPTVAFIFNVTAPLLPLAVALWAIQPGEFGKVALCQSVVVLVLFQRPVVSPLAQVLAPVAAWRLGAAASRDKAAN